ncbi:hypothetical protein OB236_38480 [Paenibacillus sp. WQ 127069]|uniref:Uncharacterized protein n=1 Tax=Paenibacillus baimaensis TaxID=2982185 RepID=A0ABT2UTR6_9BACL|nr:hypothetical protein [Paenibacillus sp. WQ 127069]MCU6798029.1 hypothetical protein [Paenibacillus sp. WQ 127069]
MPENIQTFFMDMLREEGLSSGTVYASGIIKAGSIATRAADFKSQESIQEMTARILKENNCYIDGKKAAGKGGLNVNELENMTTPSIPKFRQPDKGVHTDG